MSNPIGIYNAVGIVRQAGVEGTGTFGAGLTRALRDHEIEIWEVNRPDRRSRVSRQVRSH
ncbi:hypothetical protein YK56LOC_69940 [Caballeronia sp. HLA56]